MPYINGFIMAIKTLISTFASFIGYEMPDSTGIIDDVLAGYGDEMDDFTDSVDTANGTLDDTASKLKEIEGQLASFDKLNVIQEPTDTSSGGSGGSGGGAGSIGGIDSRLLDALNSMNYKFQEAEMLANKIRDRLLEWANILGKSINENIFEPIKNSWDKYGDSISFNFGATFSKMEILIKDFFVTTGNNFKSNFQSWSNLFFSLLETAGIIANGVADALLTIWLNGGKDLWISLGKLTSSIVDLATSINDNFVKPILRWFNNNILPTISKVIGGVLKLASNIIDGISDVIKWIAKSKTAVVGLMSVASALGAAFVMNKAISSFDKFTKAIKYGTTMFDYFHNKAKITDGVIKSLSKSVYETANNFTKTSTSAGVLEKAMNVMKNTWNNANKVISNSSMWKVAETGMKNLSTKLSSTSESTTGLASAVTGKLGAAFAWLAANQMVAAIAGITALSVGIGALILSIGDGKSEVEELNDKISNLSKKSKESAKDIEELGKKTKQSLKDGNGEYAVSEKYLNNLIELTGGSNGYVSNIEEAKFLVEKVNEVSADSVSITEDGLLVWQKQPGAIQDVINKLKEKLRLQVYEEQYTEAIKQEDGLRKTLAESTKLQSQAQDIYNQKLSETMAQHPEYSISTINGLIGEQYLALRNANEQLATATFQMSQNAWQQQALTLEQQKTTGSLSEQAIAQTALNLVMSETMGRNGELTATYASLGEQLLASNATLDLYKGKTDEVSLNEIEKATISRDYVIQSLVEKAAAHGTSYDTMIKNLEDYGIKLTAEESQVLNDSYTRYKSSDSTVETMRKLHFDRLKESFKKNGIEMSDEQIWQIVNEQSKLSKSNQEIQAIKNKQYSDLKNLLKRYNVDLDSEEGKKHIKDLKTQQENGNEAGQAFIDNLAESLKDEKKKATKEGEKTGKEVVKSIEKQEANVKVKASVDRGSVSSVGQAIANQLENIRANITVSSKGKISFNVAGYATGGFPNMGQLFVANENGPELVGKAGNKSVVANNNQVVDVILGAMERKGVLDGGNQKIVLEVPVVIEKREVGRLVKEIELEEYLKTGKKK